LHDLLRAYAAELAATDPPEQRAARHRLLDHYLHTAHPASVLISGARQPITLTPPDDTVVVERLDDAERAYAWFTAEEPILVAAVSLAVDHGFDGHAWRLQWCVSPYLNRRRTPQVEIDLLLRALDAVERLGDRPMQARLLNGLALAYLRGADADAAHRCLARALDLFTDLGDAVGRSRIHTTISATLSEQGRLAEALGHARQAHAIIESTGDRLGTSVALMAITAVYLDLGESRQVIRYGGLSIQGFHELDDPGAAAWSWQAVGRAHHQLGDYPEAVAGLEKAVTLYGADPRRAQTLDWLGDTRQAMGDHAAARRCWESALEMSRDAFPLDAAPIEQKLREGR
jgi:tetratricopeptide (TPR) repeat protein